MISTADFKTGLTILYKDHIYQILDFQHVKPGKGSAFVRTKLKDCRTGSTIEYNFNAGEKLEQAVIEKKKMQYSYSMGESYCFMDLETWEQIEIPTERLEWEKNFLVESMEIEIVFYGEEIIGINLPEKLTLTVTQSDPAVAGNTATNAMKEATLETGFVIKVPMFIKTGDKVVVTTSDGKYSARA